ncbi:MAG: phosphate/phosphite/phosphonate ABC transporter substrate-binding protein [Anaerolineales bacterium]
MNKRLTFSLLALLVCLSLALTSCGPAATEAPTAEPPTQAPAPTAVPATEAPTAVPATAAPTAIPAAKCDPLPNAMTPAAGSLGSADKPIVITFVPSVDVGKITKGGQEMADCLGKMTGLSYKIEVGTSEAASVEAMGGGKAQMGFLNTFAILLAHQKYNVDVALVAQRKYGVRAKDGSYSAFDFDPDKATAGQLASFYKPEFFTRDETGIKSLADAKGHTFCFTSAGSTSGGIIPRAMFAAMGIDPDKDLQSTYAGGHDKAAIAVYQGDCDAGVAFMDILTDSATDLQSKFPDITQKVKVFAVGERIPNDGLQFVKDFDPAMKAITVDALLAMMADPGGNAVVKSIYNYDAFEKTDFDTTYAPFQELLKKAGVDVSKLVKQ